MNDLMWKSRLNAKKIIIKSQCFHADHNLNHQLGWGNLLKSVSPPIMEGYNISIHQYKHRYRTIENELLVELVYELYS